MPARRRLSPDDSDDALMVRAGAGDRTACQRLVERHLSRIVTFAYCTTGHRGDAEDIAQEVFLRVWATAPRWQPAGGRFVAWLHRVAMNACLDLIAKRRERLAADPPDIADPRPEPSLAVHGAQIAAHVGRALASLPESQRIAVTLCHYQGLRNIEAAEVMNISVEALESLLARGRRTLRAQLQPMAAALLGRD
jgi:RNA polymerase sigma-70 factor (ECF subfamily)